MEATLFPGFNLVSHLFVNTIHLECGNRRLICRRLQGHHDGIHNVNEHTTARGGYCDYVGPTTGKQMPSIYLR